MVLEDSQEGGEEVTEEVEVATEEVEDQTEGGEEAFEDQIEAGEAMIGAAEAATEVVIEETFVERLEGLEVINYLSYSSSQLSYLLLRCTWMAL